MSLGSLLHTLDALESEVNELPEPAPLLAHELRRTLVEALGWLAMTVSAQQRFISQHPCTVCDGHDREQRGQGKRRRAIATCPAVFTNDFVSHCGLTAAGDGVP